MPIPVYNDHMTIEEALKVYFSKYHFADGGYHDKYFKIKIGPLKLPFPNTKSRVTAVKFHDIHHLLTEYTAFWKGEVEIGGWELASGCGNHFVAWLLNSGSFGIGLFLYPRSLFRAFMMGRTVKTNLYHDYTYDNALLSRTVGELRRELGIGEMEKKLNLYDYVYFIFWAVLVFAGLLLVGLSGAMLLAGWC
jgi:hypothetical protein